MSFSILFTLGLPMLLTSWFLFDHLLESGELEADNIEGQLKGLQKEYEKTEEEPTNPLMARWFKFGGGFYGLTALYTFCIIEVIDIGGFILNYPGAAALLENGLVSLLVDVLINQIMNLVNAMIWFTYWDASVLVNLGVAYAGYYCGMYLAREDILRT